MGRPPGLRGLLREILFDPERDQCPGTRPVVSLTDGDNPEYAGDLRQRLHAEVNLERRGHFHGRLVELVPDGLVRPMPRKRRLVALTMRWNAAKPIVRPGLLALDSTSPNVRALVRLRKRLTDPGGLRGWLAESAGKLAPTFTVGSPVELADPERDIEKVALSAGELTDLWLKVGRLSTHPADGSLRLRVAYGDEGRDDMSDDEERHAAIRDLFARVVPAGPLIQHSGLTAEVTQIAGTAVELTQPIVYWNTPEGGALFHHDAFPGPAAAQQLGVVYAQLEGRTAWLALSIGDLALRVREFLAEIAEGETSGRIRAFATDEIRTLAGDWSALVRELGEPGQGVLGPLVNRGPEFTAFLADSGHAAILSPGDVILLPNHGLDRTAMHSVFCASPRVATGLSLAIRRAPGGPGEPEESLPAAGGE